MKRFNRRAENSSEWVGVNSFTAGVSKELVLMKFIVFNSDVSDRSSLVFVHN